VRPVQQDQNLKPKQKNVKEVRFAEETEKLISEYAFFDEISSSCFKKEVEVVKERPQRETERIVKRDRRPLMNHPRQDQGYYRMSPSGPFFGMPPPGYRVHFLPPGFVPPFAHPHFAPAMPMFRPRDPKFVRARA
jgi:hypothetical protein